MKKNNIDQSVFRPIEHRKSEKANTVFLKLYAKLNKPKNPFDDARTQSYPAANLKPGENINVTI